MIEVPSTRSGHGDSEPAWVAVTLDALLALLRSGISPRELARASSASDGPALGQTADALSLRVIGAYRLSDGQKVWLICEQER